MPNFVVHLSDIEPKIFDVFENCYVELEPDIKRELFNAAIKASPRRSLVSLSEVLNVKLHKLSDSKNRTPIPLSLLKKLCDFLTSNGYENFSLERLERSVEYIKGMGHATKIFRPKFPLNFATSSGIRLISKLYHDGGIGNNRQPYYRNTDEGLVKEFCEDVKNVFGDMNIVIGSDPKGMKVALPRLIGYILELVGCHAGDKVLDNPSPPEWIQNLESDLIKEFIRVAMDDEGSVSNRSVNFYLAVDITSALSPTTQEKLLKLSEKERTKLLRKYSKNPEFVEKYKSKILLFDQILMEKLGIKVSGPHLYTCYTDKKRKNLRITWGICISSKNNLSTFYEKIGFKILHKKLKLKKYVENTRTISMKNQSLNDLLKMGLIITNRKGYFTDWDVANEFNYHHQHIGRIRYEGERKNFIKRIGRESHKLRFLLTECGKKAITTAQ